MKREYELRRRLRALTTLGEAVGAMKSLSAHHFREARRGVEAARNYRQGIEQILGWTGATLPAGTGPAGLLIIGGELGLCGGYNAELVRAGSKLRQELGEGPTLCVGHRLGALLQRRDVKLRQVYAAPMGVGGIPELLLRLTQDILFAYVKEQLKSFDVVSSQFHGVGAERPTTTRIIPLAKVQDGAAPAARYVSHERLSSAAVREFLYITMYDLLLDALASEYGARLVATQSAEKWLKDRSSGLRQHLLATRREASTQEMIEIAGGARARSR